MKILWIVNTIFPYPAEKIGVLKTSFGGWLNSLAECISENNDIELAIATVYKGKEILEFNDNKVTYYLIPGAPAIKYDKRLEEHWKNIYARFKPNLVHIHGTEFAHGLAFRNAVSNIKVVTSIQGLVSECSKVYLKGLEIKKIIRNITFRDIVKFDSLFGQQRKFNNRGKNEIKLIEKSDAIIGRTNWDYCNCKAINNNLKYYHCEENLRNSFYNQNWNIKDINRNTIFCSQASYPIKGFHYMLKGLSLVKKSFPDVKLIVAGDNILDTSTFKNRIRMSGYAKYLKQMITSLNLKDNVLFTGMLDEKSFRDRLMSSNVFVLPSILENSSNSLCEAMLMGMPCVASNVGGTSDLIENNKEGFLYDYTDYVMLANYIIKFFNDDELCIKYGNNAKYRANIRHNLNKNCMDVINIYKEIINSEKQ